MNSLIETSGEETKGTLPRADVAGNHVHQTTLGTQMFRTPPKSNHLKLLPGLNSQNTRTPEDKHKCRIIIVFEVDLSSKYGASLLQKIPRQRRLPDRIKGQNDVLSLRSSSASLGITGAFLASLRNDSRRFYFTISIFLVRRRSPASRRYK